MRRDADFLLDILQAARLALGFVRGKTFDESCADIQCHFAAVRAVEVIGEAATGSQTLPGRSTQSFPGGR